MASFQNQQRFLLKPNEIFWSVTFDNFIVKQENFTAYFGRQLKYDSDMIKYLGDYMANIRGELKLVSKHASMVTTQVEQVLKAQKEVLDEMNSNKNDYDVRVATRTGRMTQEPLYPERHPKRIEQRFSKK